MAGRSTADRKAAEEARAAAVAEADGEPGVIEWEFRGQKFSLATEAVTKDPRFFAAMSFGRLDELLPRLFPEFADQNRVFSTFRDGDTTESWASELVEAFGKASGQGNS